MYPKTLRKNVTSVHDQQMANPQHTISDVWIALRLDLLVAALSGNAYRVLDKKLSYAQKQRVSYTFRCNPV